MGWLIRALGFFRNVVLLSVRRMHGFGQNVYYHSPYIIYVFLGRLLIVSKSTFLAVPPPTQVGLAVDHDAVPKMITKYQALLDKLAASDMPPTAQYRINIEKIARFRIKAAQENLDDPEKVEELCNCGQVEELVVQADNEMIVMDMYLRNRWWELVKPVEIEFNPDPNDDGGVEWGEETSKEEEKK